MAAPLKPQPPQMPTKANFLSSVRHDQSSEAAAAQARRLHPAAQEAAAIYSNALEAVDRLEAANVRLANELEIERRHCNELQHQLDSASERRDYFYRYAIEVRTHLQTIVQAATMADNRALDVARSEPKGQIEKAPESCPETLEHQIADVLKTIKKVE